MIHQFNIVVHVVAGTLALFLGLAALFAPKISLRHKRLGRYFLFLLSVVVASGFIGWLLFRSNPFLLMLTLLSGYTGYAGWRAVRLKEQRSAKVDVLVALVVLSAGLLFLIFLKRDDASWNPVVIYSTLGALGMVTLYDIVKFFWLFPYIKKWWLYEHIYKMISAFSAILSAFIGTLLPGFKPFSQIGPSSLCVLLIVVLIWREVLKRKRGIYL